MTEIEKKALALLQECGFRGGYIDRKWNEQYEALCRAIEQHEAFQQEVSDAVEDVRDNTTYDVHPKLWRYIRTKPDPLVEVLQEISGEGGYDNFDHYAYRLRSALEARGLEIKEKQP